MHIRMTTVDGAAERFDDVLALLRDRVQPLVDGLPGSRGLAALVSRERGRVIATTAWDSAEDRAASDAALAPLRAEAAELLGGAVTVEELELAVFERIVPASAGCWTRMTRTSVDASRIEEGIVAFSTQVLPALRALPGFCTAVLLVDRATGTAITATTWASRQALDDSAPRMQGLRQAVTSSLGTQVLDVTAYEVAITGIRPPQQHEGLFRRAYAAMSAGGDLDDLDALVHEDLVEHAPVPPGTPSGLAGLKALMGTYRSGMPDLTFSVERYLEQGDLGCAVLKVTGTHTGTLLGIAPTGKRIEIDAIDVVRIADGRAAEHWGASDDLGMLTQLGVVSPPAEIPGQHAPRSTVSTP